MSRFALNNYKPIKKSKNKILKCILENNTSDITRNTYGTI